tara:strand:+ start:240 stop:920 length:681 start_codon:yes stop_codon:yes gene_type:complete
MRTSPKYLKIDRVKGPMFDPLYHANRVVIGFIQGLFKALPESMYTWSEDPEKTEILITDAAPITSEVLTARPCIVTVRGQAQYANVTMNSVDYVDPATQTRSYRDVISSSITVNCISRNGVEAARLAWFVASYVKALRHLLHREGPFVRIGHDVAVMGEMPPGALLQDPSDVGAVNVPVIIQFVIAHRWEVREPSLTAREIRVNIDDTPDNSDDVPARTFTIEEEA